MKKGLKAKTKMGIEQHYLVAGTSPDQEGTESVLLGSSSLLLFGVAGAPPTKRGLRGAERDVIDVEMLRYRGSPDEEGTEMDRAWRASSISDALQECPGEELRHCPRPRGD